MSMRRAYPSANHQQQYGHVNSLSQSMSSSTATKTNEMLEQENDEMMASLQDKVSALRTLSIDIGDEVKLHNTMLGNMDPPGGGFAATGQNTEFGSTGSLLSSSMKRLKGLGQAGHNNWMCYMIIFILFVFLLLYYIIRWR